MANEAGEPKAVSMAHPGRWQVMLAMLAIGASYLVLGQRYLDAPSWLVLLLIVVAIGLIDLAVRSGYLQMRRRVVLGLLLLLTAALVFSTGKLLRELLLGQGSAPALLANAALIWMVNVLLFASWYWEIDDGGPIKRHHGTYHSSDFVFPQMMLNRPEDDEWRPQFFDYLFLAFNTSTAFSPTDTAVVSRRAKLLLMLQSLLSLIVISVLAARAVNILR